MTHFVLYFVSYLYYILYIVFVLHSISYLYYILYRICITFYIIFVLHSISCLYYILYRIRIAFYVGFVLHSISYLYLYCMYSTEHVYAKAHSVWQTGYVNYQIESQSENLTHIIKSNGHGWNVYYWSIKVYWWIKVSPPVYLGIPQL